MLQKVLEFKAQFYNVQFRQDSGDTMMKDYDGDTMMKVTESMAEMQKQATEIGEKLNADVVLVQKHPFRPFHFKNPLQPLPKIIKNKLEQVSKSLYGAKTALNTLADRTSQSLKADKVQEYIKNVSFVFEAKTELEILTLNRLLR